MVRTILDTIILGAAACFLGAGLYLAVSPYTVRLGEAYARSPQCDQPAEALHQRCWVKVASTVVHAGAAHRAPGEFTPVVTLVVPEFSTAPVDVHLARPPAAFYQLEPGQAVALKVWAGRYTALFVSDTIAIRTLSSPYETDPLSQSGGLYLLAVGGVVLAVHPPFGDRRKGSPARLVISSSFTNRRLQIAFAAFALTQVLDVVTSLKGGAVGLFEGNPTAAAITDRLGPALGLIAIKVPAVGAMVLIVARLPPRFAIVVTWAGTAIMIYVVLQNVGLILYGGVS